MNYLLENARQYVSIKFEDFFFYSKIFHSQGKVKNN